jgi:hypothetical protein
MFHKLCFPSTNDSGDHLIWLTALEKLKFNFLVTQSDTFLLQAFPNK